MTLRLSLFVSLALVGTPAAWAQESADVQEVPEPTEAETAEVLAEARRLVQAGQDLFRTGQYEAALEQFRQGESRLRGAGLTVPATLHRVLGRCYDQLGLPAPAQRYFELFLEGAPDDDPRLAGSIRRAREAVNRLRRQLERTSLHVEVEPEGTEVRIDDRLVGTTPLAPVRLAPGQHQVTLWSAGHRPVTVSVTALAGASVSLVAELLALPPEPAPAPAPAPAATRSPAPASALLPWVSVTAALVATATAVCVAVLAYGGADPVDRRAMTK